MLQLITAFLRALTPQQHLVFESDPVLGHARDRVLSPAPTSDDFATFWWYVLCGGTFKGVPMLKDANFIYQVEQALGAEQNDKWIACNKGDIWSFAGVQKHIVTSGKLRPVIDWRN